MILASLLAFALAPVTLEHRFTAGQISEYEVNASMTSEVSMPALGLFTAMPEDIGFRYKFTTEVVKLKPDGFAEVRYRRPNFVVILGETVDSAPKVVTQPIKQDVLLTLSPVNELLDAVDQKNLRLFAALQSGEDSPLDNFVDEARRMALFIGGLQSSLDLSPRLPLDEIKIGESWKRTVGYQPQKLQGAEGKMAVQRLDLTYTYKGLVAKGAKQVHRIHGSLNLNTDLFEFANSYMEKTAEQTGLKAMPLTLKTEIDYDLDPLTCQTLEARSSSSGTLSISVTKNSKPMHQETFSGSSTLKLLSNKKR